MKKIVSPMQTLTEHLQTLPPRHSLIRCDSEEWTAGDLIERADTLRQELMRFRGQRVGVCCQNPEKFIQLLIALDGFVEGMVLLPVSLPVELRSSLLKQANAVALIEDDKVQQTDLPAERKFSLSSWILATSGTTGIPKMIEHSLPTLARTVKTNSKDARTYIWGQVYDPCRFAGLQVILQAVLGGSKLVFSSSGQFEDQLDIIENAGVNSLSATPSQWRKILFGNRLNKNEMKRVTLGGEIVDDNLLINLRTKFSSARITHIYASTEAGVGFSVSDGRAGFPLSWLSGHGPVPLKMAENNNLLIRPTILPSGEEIRVRTRPDGFLDTEDTVRIVGERVMFVGRCSGAINVGGNKVHPEEIELVILEVEHVREVMVFGKKSSMMGELVAAQIVPDDKGRENSEELKKEVMSHCKSKLERYKLPVLLTVIEKIDTNSVGKVARFQ